MLSLPWKTKGICIGAPMPSDMGMFEEFEEKVLAPGGCNLIVMLVRYRYRFKSHPECINPNGPLGEADAKRIAALCRKHNIRLVPKMNLLGHQSGRVMDTVDGLLRGHPEFDETPEMDEVFYCRSLCPRHPDVKPVVFDLMDELAGAFEADAIHIGMDEVFDIGKCGRCKDTPTYRLFAEWVNALADHNRERGGGTFMWGDRLLNGLESGYGPWEASGNFTEPAINLVDKDITICDWHYENLTKFPSVETFAGAGFKILLSPWRYKAHAEQFFEYAKANDRGHIEGVLATTWTGPASFMRYMLTGEHSPGVKNKESAEALSETLCWIFSKD
jgi:hypothetical protein